MRIVNEIVEQCLHGQNFFKANKSLESFAGECRQAAHLSEDFLDVLLELFLYFDWLEFHCVVLCCVS